MLVIPSIDLQAGRCVRLRQGDFERVSVYDAEPSVLAARYAKLGASCLHLVDLDGAQKGSPQHLSLIETLKDKGLTLQFGGGIRQLVHAKDILKAGISKLVIGSIAITNADLVLDILKEVGSEKVILALDVNIQEGIPKPAIHGWEKTSDRSLWEVVDFYQTAGVKTILCTDIAMDGMMAGPNFDLYDEACDRFPDIAWQASGGVRDGADLKKLNSLGVAAAIMGRTLYENKTDEDLRRLFHFASA
jgi:phosphoribosylformimino-5-aminoimidazole carboxamide ribotide isomerase